MTTKNFLLFSIDDMRSSDSWGNFSSLISTPNLDALMEQGTTFTRAVSQAPLCNPSRASFFTGQQPSQTGVLDNASPWFERVDPALTLPGILKAAGAYVAMFGKHFHPDQLSEEQRATLFDEFIPGSDRGNAQIGDNDYRQQNPFPSGTWDGPAEELRDVIVANEAVKFLQERAPGLEQPFFLGVGIFKPHMNWFVPAEYFERYDRAAIRAALDQSLADGTIIPGALEYSDVPGLSRPSPEHAVIGRDLDLWAGYIHAYLAALSFADARVGDVLAALAANPELAAETSILLWSDHGYQLGDKNVWGKFTHWRESSEVPLVIVDPDLPGGAVANQIVSLVDIFPTILDMMGVAAPEGLDLAGESLTPILRDTATEWVDPATGRGVALTTIHGSFSVRTDVPGVGEVRYTIYPDGQQELYTLADDPLEHVNRLDPATGIGLTEADDLVAAAMRATMDVALDRAGILLSDGIAPTIGDDRDNILVATIGEGINELHGGAGDDTYVLYAGATIVEEEGGGRDAIIITDATLEAGFQLPDNVEMAMVVGSLVGNAGDNWITSQFDGILEGRGGDDVLIGGSGQHILRGGAGNDVLRGGNGDDRLSGGGGRDTLDGGAGADLLLGGSNADTLRGGEGDDIFDFNRVGHSRPDMADLILDFEGAGTPGGDLIDVAHIDADPLLPGDQAFAFGLVGPGGLWVVAGETGGSEVLADVDGDGVADLRILVARIAPERFTADDFIL